MGKTREGETDMKIEEAEKLLMTTIDFNRQVEVEGAIRDHWTHHGPRLLEAWERIEQNWRDGKPVMNEPESKAMRKLIAAASEVKGI